jgi:hypothetical protein
LIFEQRRDKAARFFQFQQGFPLVSHGEGHIVPHYKDELQGKTFTVEEYRSFVFGLIAKLVKPVALAAPWEAQEKTKVWKIGRLGS